MDRLRLWTDAHTHMMRDAQIQRHKHEIRMSVGLISFVGNGNHRTLRFDDFQHPSTNHQCAGVRRCQAMLMLMLVANIAHLPVLLRGAVGTRDLIAEAGVLVTEAL